MAFVVQAVEQGDVKDINLDLLLTDLDISYAKAEDNLHQAGVAGVAETRTVDEMGAIALYTCKNYYGPLNKALREANREAVVPHVEFIWLFMHALRKCSKYTGHMVYRGMKGELFALKIIWLLFYVILKHICLHKIIACVADLPAAMLQLYTKGRRVTWYQVSSCTSSVEVENTFLGSSGNRVMFNI